MTFILFQVSTLGIHDMVKNCPSLQVLNLSECQNIDDKAVRYIATNVRRLKELYIDRCYKLSDHSLDAIALECKFIKVRVDGERLVPLPSYNAFAFYFRYWMCVDVEVCARSQDCD